jgi:RimJ/RimL family protein N-acetyltransferase
MIAEIPQARIPAYAAWFPGPHLELVMASIAAGNSAAQLWEAEQAGQPAVALLWDKGNNVFYFSGNHTGPATQRAFGDLIAADIRPRALAERSRYFKAHAISPALEDALVSLFKGIRLHDMPTLFYGFTQPRPAHVASPSVEGIRFMPIDRAFLAAEQLQHIERVRAEIRWMWRSEERFCEYGLGYAAVVQDQVVCWCTAEYLSAERCGIGIETIRAYERRGVATATAARFVQLCLDRGVAPFWECRANNAGSIRVAEKVGFTRLAEERYWVGEFGD